MSQLPPGFVLDQPAPRGGVFQLPPTPQQAAQTTKIQSDIGNDAARIAMERERLRIAREEAARNAQSASSLAEINAYKLEDARREADAKNPFRPTVLAGIQNDAKQKLSVIDRIIEQYRNGVLPAVGFGSQTASRVPGTNAANLRVSLGELSQAGALRSIMDLAQQNGGKNPLTPMSNSDVQLVANTVSGIDPNQQSPNEFFKSLEPYRNAYKNAYAGAVGTRALGDAIEQQVSKWRSEHPRATMVQERIFRDVLTRNAQQAYDRKMADKMLTNQQPRGQQRGGNSNIVSVEKVSD